ncbi:MAG: EamA family transporter [Oscillospiraceae bacterium]|jgi:drug/metabolite transporter (DMT)-like permease|nr:EamA family transporter [Oscillospiraceae bacterium]
MWFWFSVLALLAWSGSDLFSKIGCVDAKDKYSHLKMAMAVGIVMGIHAAYEIYFGGVEVTAEVFIKYLPVSALYILSMTIGYLGLRYIELSVSSPICNSSGAIVAILTIILCGGFSEIHPVALIAVALVSIGVIALGFVESNEDEELRAERQSESGHKYAKSALALIIPIIYCLLDALGTFADSRVLEVLDEDAANTAYELTFFLVGIVCFAFLLVKKQRFTFKAELPKYTGAVFETIGQFFYIYALADSRHVAFAAPIISSYCAASVVWSRLFLKEKLSKKHYAAIVVVIAGVIILGILDI